jgi:hypothetical protein
VFQIVDFSSISDLKFAYVHLQFQNFFRGYNPRTPMIKGREGKGGEGKERRQGKEGKEGRGAKEGMGWGEPPENKSWLRPCMKLTTQF